VLFSGWNSNLKKSAWGIIIDAIMQDQDEFIIRDTNLGDAALVASDRANLEDIACNTDLYISNHEDLIQTGAFGLDNG